jgi:hypothetical protein
VFSHIQAPALPGLRGRINVFSFDRDTLERAGMGDTSGSSTPPFLVGGAARCRCCWCQGRAWARCMPRARARCQLLAS